MKKTIRLNKISLAALLNNHKLRAYELMSTHMHRNGCWSLNTTHYHLSRKSLGLKIAPHAYRSTTRKKKDNNYLAEQHAFTWSISINVWPYGWRINKFVTAIEWTSSNSKRIKSENKKNTHTHNNLNSNQHMKTIRHALMNGFCNHNISYTLFIWLFNCNKVILAYYSPRNSVFSASRALLICLPYW